MRAVLYPDATTAKTALDAINRSLGYPRTYTRADVDAGLVVELGGGRHAPVASLRTDTYAVLMDAPGGVALLYADDEVSKAAVAAKGADATLIPKARDVVDVLPTGVTLVAVDVAVDPKGGKP